jgi:hypothetical protein
VQRYACDGVSTWHHYHHDDNDISRFRRLIEGQNVDDARASSRIPWALGGCNRRCNHSAEGAPSGKIGAGSSGAMLDSTTTPFPNSMKKFGHCESVRVGHDECTNHIVVGFSTRFERSQQLARFL